MKSFNMPKWPISGFRLEASFLADFKGFWRANAYTNNVGLKFFESYLGIRGMRHLLAWGMMMQFTTKLSVLGALKLAMLTLALQ